MDASDWRYVAEGGKHAIFSFHGRETQNDDKSHDDSKWKGRLLRLRKSDLAKSPFMIATPTATMASRIALDGPTINKSNSHSHGMHCPNGQEPEGGSNYIRNVVQPLFLPYVDEPKLIYLPWPFVFHLRKQALPYIASSRLDDWADNSSDFGLKTDATTIVVTAFIMLDYRRINLNHDSINTPHYLSVEMKPKAGYQAFSPLIDPTRRIKFLHSRFSIMQRTARRWNNQNNALTLYNPLDLFSQDRSRIKNALQNLWNNPGNNFRVWLNGESMAKGDYAKSPTTNARKSADCPTAAASESPFTASAVRLNAFFDLDKTWADSDKGKHDINISEPHQDHECQRNVLLSVVSAVLLQEPLLQKLLQIQMLDMLDADGAIIIYQHLLNVCGVSQETVEARIDATVVTIFQERCENTSRPSNSLPLLHLSPLTPPTDPALVALCCHIAAFAKQLQQVKYSGDNDIEAISIHLDADDARQVALDLIQNGLTVESCTFLLQNWLLSLAMCDASFFITIQPAPVDDAIAMCQGFDDGQGHSFSPQSSSASICGNHQNGKDATWRVQQTFKGEKAPGIIFRYASSTTGCSDRPDAAFLYAVKIIDCDQKPARKLRTRIEKERMIHEATIADS